MGVLRGGNALELDIVVGERPRAWTAVLTSPRNGVDFDLQDLALEQVLRAAVRGRHDLYEAGGSEAALLVTDRPLATADRRRRARAARRGRRSGGRNSLDSLDPGLILSAASLIAAGYALDRDRLAERARPGGRGCRVSASASGRWRRCWSMAPPTR